MLSSSVFCGSYKSTASPFMCADALAPLADLLDALVLNPLATLAHLMPRRSKSLDTRSAVSAALL